MSSFALRRLVRPLSIIPIVALASYFLMVSLPLSIEADSKRQLPTQLLASYRRDLGIGNPLGFLQPWNKLFRGERLGTSAQGITGAELLVKLSGSVGVGLVALALALVWAGAFTVVRVRLRRSRLVFLGELAPAVAFGTPVFVPALLLAPYTAEAGHFLPELSAALVISCWPGIYLGTLLSHAVEVELSSDYVRTALAKGIGRAEAFWRHVLPNLLPAVLDAIGPVATGLLAGSFAAERVFGLPYFGQLYVLAVLQKQIAVVVVATTCFASLLAAVSIGTELIRAIAVPRSRAAL